MSGDQNITETPAPAHSIEERIALLVQAADEKSARHWRQMGFTYSGPPRHRADYISDRWCRIVTLDHRPSEGPEVYRDSSVYCFVCLRDGFTKTLGTLTAGDIHKAASFKAPAKRARGNVFRERFADGLTEHGAVYLR